MAGRWAIFLLLLFVWVSTACGCAPHNRTGAVKIDTRGEVAQIVVDELTLITWNIAKNIRGNDEIHRLVSHHSPDILLIQEGVSATCDLFGESFHQCLFAPSWKNASQDIYTGVKVLSRFHLENPVHIPSPSLEGFVFTPKASIIATLDLPAGGQLMLINVHMLNFVPLSHLESYLDTIYDHVADHVGPMIVGGDFNTWNNARLMAVEQFAAKLGMVEALAYYETAPGGTPPAWLFLLKPFMQLDLDSPLDRWFCRGLEVISCRYLDGFNSSDHAPILLQVRLNHP
jgi:endonuclease/exonuclease/phosphatase (EEP) superfamily protein YafD